MPSRIIALNDDSLNMGTGWTVGVSVTCFIVPLTSVHRRPEMNMVYGRVTTCAVGRYIGYHRLRNQSASSRNAGHLVLACRSCMKRSASVEDGLSTVPSTAISCQIHAYTLSWQSLLGPDTAVCFLDVKLFQPLTCLRLFGKRGTTCVLKFTMLVHSLEEANSVGDLLSCLLQARRSHPTDQSYSVALHSKAC
jgi:hypothetical protein